MKMFVSTNSALMEFGSSPLDFAPGAAVGSIASSIQEPAFGFGIALILFHKGTNRFRHDFCHRLVMGGCVDPETAQERLGKTHVTFCVAFTQITVTRVYVTTLLAQQI